MDADYHTAREGRPECAPRAEAAPVGHQGRSGRDDRQLCSWAVNLVAGSFRLRNVGCGWGQGAIVYCFARFQIDGHEVVGSFGGASVGLSVCFRAGLHEVRRKISRNFCLALHELLNTWRCSRLCVKRASRFQRHCADIRMIYGVSTGSACSGWTLRPIIESCVQRRNSSWLPQR